MSNKNGMFKTLLGGIYIDVLFGSESYCEYLSQALNARAFLVDLNRETVPISARLIFKKLNKNSDLS